MALRKATFLKHFYFQCEPVLKGSILVTTGWCERPAVS